MAPKKQDRQSRQSRERLRAYQARRAVHDKTLARRRRDNVFASIGLVIVLVLAVVAQVSYFGAGPGKSSASAASTTDLCTQKPDAKNTGDVPARSVSECRTWTGTMTINSVPLGIRLDGRKAPQAVASTVSLIQKGFYTGVSCHRLTTGGFFVLQCGDPTGDGTGGPGYSYGPLENVPKDNLYPAGTIAMARSTGNPQSQGSQFFIVYKDTTISADAAGGYTVIGSVTSGLPELAKAVTDAGVADGSTDGKPKVPTVITSVTVR
ncbi:MAG: peptidylprolyl isomerase [Microbacteriaceae bacterium]